MGESWTILNPRPREHQGEGFLRPEVTLANRNSGIHLEMLRYDVTPAGQHYLLSHFDVPYVPDASDWQLTIGGEVSDETTLGLSDLQSMPRVTERVMMECAGNGRALVSPRWLSQPWQVEAVGNAEWTGCRLSEVMKLVDIKPGACEVVFSGTDQGVDGGVVHHFERSLTLEQANSLDVLLVWQMNGQPLLPQHGFPLRLIVPGWFGMASVKWLSQISFINRVFDGYQQVKTYRYRTDEGDPGIPITDMKVKSLLVPPGIPDWLTRQRLLKPGRHQIFGRAWSGAGVAIEQVQLGLNDQWFDATLDSVNGKYAWRGWWAECDVDQGDHVMSCRATDINGQTQPINPVWDHSGMGNNAVQQVQLHVTDSVAWS